MTNFKDFPLWIVVAQFLNRSFMLFMGRSGLEVLSALPKFYLSDDCPPGKEWLRLTRKVVSADAEHPWSSLDEEEAGRRSSRFLAARTSASVATGTS